MPKANLMVLESSWSDEIVVPTTSIKPFIDGFSAVSQHRTAYHSFQDERTFRYWLRQFFLSDIPILYVAGHGKAGQLRPLLNNRIDFARILPRCLPNKRLSKKMKPKGVLIGACSLGGAEYREDIIRRTRHPLTWIGTYDRTVPWLETTFSDILFVSYILDGRCVQKDGEFLMTETNIMRVNKARDATHAFSWLEEDYPLAVRAGFGITDRRVQ